MLPGKINNNMDIKIRTNNEDFVKNETRRRALQKISDKIEDDVLLFLAELADGKDINNKLRKNKLLIRTSLWANSQRQAQL